MVNRLAGAWILVAGFSWAAPNVDPAAMTAKCAPGQKLLVSCLEKARGAKTVLLLCGSKDLAAETGTAQFRLGVLGMKPTVRWPEIPVHPSRFVTVTRGVEVTTEEFPNGFTLMLQVTTVDVTLSTPSAVAVVSIVETFQGGAESAIDSSASVRASGMTRKFNCSNGQAVYDLLQVVPVVEKDTPPEKTAPRTEETREP
jgi:hypothetical protein